MRPDFSKLIKGGQDGKILRVRKASERLLRRARPSGVAPFIHLTTPRRGLTRTVFRRAKADGLSPHYCSVTYDSKILETRALGRLTAPSSHALTVDDARPRRSASCVRVRPSLSRAARMISPKAAGSGVGLWPRKLVMPERKRALGLSSPLSHLR